MKIDHRTSLRDQLVLELRVAILNGRWAPGDRLPSVRALACERDVSTATAAQVFNALAASGLVLARPGSGYYVANQRGLQTTARTAAVADALWERRIEAPGDRIRVDAGGGWLPTEWQYVDGVTAALRDVARHPGHSEGYGSPNGYEPLRAYFAQQLTNRSVQTTTGEIVLTQGASQALDLVVRTLLEPGDAVVVEDPAYPPTLELLRARGVQLHTIPRLADGPDTDALARLLSRRRFRAFFTNTTLQNPTGTSTSEEKARRILQLAEKADLQIVEDDIFAELADHSVKPLASFEAEGRVLYVSSISKTVSPTLRVGYVRARGNTLPKLVRLKSLSALASSELSERIALSALTRPNYRSHLRALRQRLRHAQRRVQAILVESGLELAHRPDGGMFLWGRLPSRDAVGKVWREALGAGILLAPGESFHADGRASPWWRFNVAHCDDGALQSFLASAH